MIIISLMVMLMTNMLDRSHLQGAPDTSTAIKVAHYFDRQKYEFPFFHASQAWYSRTIQFRHIVQRTTTKESKESLGAALIVTKKQLASATCYGD